MTSCSDVANTGPPVDGRGDRGLRRVAGDATSDERTGDALPSGDRPDAQDDIESASRPTGTLLEAPVDVRSSAPRLGAAVNIPQMPKFIEQSEPADSHAHWAYDTLELVKNGLHPVRALASLADGTSCGWHHVLGILAREWDSAAIPIGGFDRSRLMSGADLPNRDSFSNRLAALLTKGCLDGHGDEETAGLLRHAFLPFTNLDRLHTPVTSDSHAIPVDAVRVLRATADAIVSTQELVRDYLATDATAHDHRLNAWMEIYLSAVEGAPCRYPLRNALLCA